MSILTKAFKTGFTLMAALSFANCSGHHSTQVESANSDAPPSLSEELPAEVPILASTDNVPVSDSLTPQDAPPPQDAPVPKQTPRKIHRASPHRSHATTPLPVTEVAESQIEEPAQPPVEMPSAQQAQMSTSQATLPEVTPVPQRIEALSPTPVPVENSSAPNPSPVSNDKIRYGIVAAIFVLVGILIYRRKKSS